MLGDGSPAGHTRSLLALSDVLGAHNRITTSRLPSCIQGGPPSAGLWVGLGVLPRAPVAQGFCDGLGQRRLATGARVQRHCSGSPGTLSHDPPPAWFFTPASPSPPSSATLSLWEPQSCPWHSPAQSLSVAPHDWRAKSRHLSLCGDLYIQPPGASSSPVFEPSSWPHSSRVCGRKAPGSGWALREEPSRLLPCWGFSHPQTLLDHVSQPP